MNLNIAQKFLIFRDTTISRLKAQGEINETTLIYIKDLEQKCKEITEEKASLAAEISELKKQFADLLNNLKAEEETVIRKQEEAVAELNIPNGDEIAKMDWSDINALVERLEGQL